MLWRPLALAALNQPSDRAAAPVFVRVLAEMFGPSAHAAAIGLPSRPLHLAYAEPARTFIEQRGGEVRTGAAATIHMADGAVESVDVGGQPLRPRAVVCAVPWFAMEGVFKGSVGATLAAVIARAASMTASPIVTVNLWFDRPLLAEPFVGLPGRVMQWVFERRLAVGDEASHLSLVSSGAESVVALPNEQLAALAHQELLDALPPAREARLLRSAVVRERQATFSLAPGQPARPSTATGIDGLVLAGDWIDTGLPATIESAVRSGHRAADVILARS
jgi:hypothetical protein